jgi:hypothetical protein
MHFVKQFTKTYIFGRSTKITISMGSTKDVMELFAERTIRQLFSEYDGWNIAPVTGVLPAGHFYQITRGKWGGEETAFIAVAFDPVPREDIFSTLDRLSGGRGSRTKKYLLVPQATDTSGVPPHVRILLMNEYAFSEGILVWLTKKKNAKKLVLEQAVTV